MHLLPFVHLLGVGLWLGCILVEVAFERALAGDRHQRLILSELHRNVDLWVEVPAFVLVLITGLLMVVHGAPLPANIVTKIAVGSMAIVANTYCVWLVLKRRRLALADNEAAFARVDHRQHQWGTVVLLGVVVALALGLYGAAG